MFTEFETVARAAALEAGEIIREHVGRMPASQIHTKGPSDYVTEVDTRCEDLILRRVTRAFPDHHIMSEETESRGLQPGYTWVIDPLDGTTNFIHGFPFVAVSIALCRDMSPVVGVVFDPLRNELFTAARGKGARLNGTLIQRKPDVGPGEALVATGFPRRIRPYMDSYLKAFKAVFLEVSGIRRGGSAALDLAYLGVGRVDGFWEIGLRAWDIAAGSLIVEESGGVVSDFRGEDDYLNSGNIVGGSSAVHHFLLEQVRKWINPALEAGGP